MYDENQEPYQVIGATQDITEYEELLQERESIMESIKDNFYVIDNDLNIQFCNKSMNDYVERLMGIRELSGKHIYDVFPMLQETDFSYALAKALETNTAVRLEWYVELVDDWFEHHFYPFNGGCTILFKSIKNRKLAEEKLLTINHELIEKTEELKNDLLSEIRYAYLYVEYLTENNRQDAIPSDLMSFVNSSAKYRLKYKKLLNELKTEAEKNILNYEK